LSDEAAAAAAEVSRLEAADIRTMWADDLEAFVEVMRNLQTKNKL
jgi:hypothetical protein